MKTNTQVSRILKYCNERNIRVVPRGSGTSLSGGALPLADAVLAALNTKDNRVEKAMNNALNVVPGPFRRPVKKMLFG